MYGQNSKCNVNIQIHIDVDDKQKRIKGVEYYNVVWLIARKEEVGVKIEYRNVC